MSIAKRAKDMIMGEIDIGQFQFRSTGTMLPKCHQDLLEPLLALFTHGVIVVDVAAGSKRSALGLLVPKTKLSNWTPEDRYIVQTATTTSESPECVVELVSPVEITSESWELSEKRKHVLNEIPKRHMTRIAKIAQTEQAFKTIWDSMSLVFIWEREEGDNLAALIEYVTSIAILS